MQNLKSLKKSIFVLAILLATATSATLASSGDALAEPPQQEFYELRTFKIFDIEKQKFADEYLKNALLPALNRQKIENVGVFHNLEDPNDHSIFVLIPFPSLEAFATYNQKLGVDQEYQTVAEEYMDWAKDDGLFDRIESRLLRAFSSSPKMTLADFSKNKTDRIFELRLYESQTEEHARRKVEMFNTGESKLMRDVGLGPVFFGESLAGPDLPNLVYMLSAESKEAHEAHWEAFLKSEVWAEMKKQPKYKDTVSKIKKWFLTPTPFSQF